MQNNVMKEIRSNSESFSTSSSNRKISGYAIVVNRLSGLIENEFKEIIRPSALEGVIENNDIVDLLDHNIKKGVLARSRYGEGSLKLSVDEKGLKFEFDAPHTVLGDELLENIRRGEISTCSFAFYCGEDRWSLMDDGTPLREILSFRKVVDISQVYVPAYSDTSVICARGLKLLEEEMNIKKKEETLESRSEVENIQSDSELDDEKKTEEEVTKEGNDRTLSGSSESVEEKSDCEKDDDSEKKNDESVNDESDEKNDESEEKDETRNLNDNLYIIDNTHKFMNKKFSLIKTINDVVNNRNLDEIASDVIKEGRSAAAKANVETNGQIILALEKRAEGDTETPATVTPNGIMATEATMGKEAIPTETFEIVGALRDKMVLAEAGAQFMSLQGNVEIPLYSGANCAWASEIGEAADGSGKFTSVKLSPKRLTATLPISRQFLIQSSASAEALLRNDLINCIAEKLQKTILGNGAGDAVTPKGMLNGVTADTAAFTYDDAVDMEAVLESANVYGDYKYVVSPNAKAALRTISMDKGSGKFIYENNAVLGIDAKSTNSVVNKGVILGDWRELLIGVFGALDIVVDPYTAAAKGQVILTVNAYFDYVERRPEAFVKRILK